MSTPSVWPVLIGTGFFLGLGVPVAKAAAAAGVSALGFALWPTACASLVLALLAAWRHGRPRLDGAVLRYAFTAGVLGHTLPMTTVFWLSAHAGAGYSALAFTLPPIFTLMFSLGLRLERFHWLRLAAVLVGLCGALLLVAGRGAAASASALAVVLLLAVPAFIGAGNVYRALKLPHGMPGEWLAAMMLGASSICLAAVAAPTGLAVVPATAMAWGWLAVQALAMVAGFTLYFVLQRRAEPVTFSLMGYVITLTGVVAGTGLLGEPLPGGTLPALVLTVAALWLMHRARLAAPVSVARP